MPDALVGVLCRKCLGVCFVDGEEELYTTRDGPPLADLWVTTTSGPPELLFWLEEALVKSLAEG